MNKRIYLASSSPRRRELLGNMGLAFEILPADADEKTDAAPREAVRILAERKARCAARGVSEGLVIGADTLVSLNDRALGKPGSPAAAREMLLQLSGKSHEVFTGVCVIDAATGREALEADRSVVVFREIGEDEIDAYVRTGEPLDKAGAYAIQGGAKAFVKRLEGSFTNVMGLPVELLEAMLRKFS